MKKHQKMHKKEINEKVPVTKHNMPNMKFTRAQTAIRTIHMLNRIFN